MGTTREIHITITHASPSGGFSETRQKFEDFIQSPPLRPKSDIADLISREGIPVPRRIKGLGEALDFVQQGGEIIIRSEHPLEFGGASGLLESYIVNQQKIREAQRYCDEWGTLISWERVLQKCYRFSEFDAIRKILGNITSQDGLEQNLKLLSFPRVNRYCSFLGLCRKGFMDAVHYSYWERLSGYNRSIIADSSIPGRYHIFNWVKDGSWGESYTLVEGGKVIASKPDGLPPELENSISDTLAFYEGIRHPKHCPMIEFQTKDRVNYFLQYHHTGNEDFALWELTREKETGEIDATFVRGHTPAEGVVIDVSLYYYKNQVLVDNADNASFDAHYDDIFSEIMSRRRYVNLVFGNYDEIAYSSRHAQHLPKSRIFNPPLFIALNRSDVVDEELLENSFSLTKVYKTPSKIRMRIISDGRRAYIKILGIAPPTNSYR